MSLASEKFAEQVAPLRPGLLLHCYRMLGSSHDAEDAVQETLLRGWRGVDRFEGRSSLRTWLYTVATNVCLREVERRGRRLVPVELGPASDPADGLAAPLLIVAVSLGLFALLMLFLGVLGEQVRQIAERSRGVPLVLEAERIGFPPGRDQPPGR